MILGGGSQRGSANYSNPGKYAVGRPVIVEPHNITKALTFGEDFFVCNNINRTDDDTGQGQPTWLGQLLEPGKVCGRPPRNRRTAQYYQSPHFW